ncbi:hypothetical protein JTB14_033313 [Gonioctena quinquepunctata]|nr:hypothetical protein JTB14_033313 [Gonioctena quinquepunctata]
MILKVLILVISIKCFVSEEVNIAGLFESDTDLDKIFVYAIELLNRNQNEDHFKLVPLTHERIPENNPYLALQNTCLFLNIGVVAIFGPRSFDNINIVQSICDSKEVPHIITRWNNWPLRDSSEINFYPHPPLLTKAYFDILMAWEWKTFTVLYEDDEGL